MKKVLGIIGAIVLVGGIAAFDWFTGSELGGPCVSNTDCKGNIQDKIGKAQCLDDGYGSYCTLKCATVADCPPGWACEVVQMVDVTTNMNTGEANQVCARPVPGQMVPGQPMPGQMMPDQPVPGQMMPGQPVPQPMPGQPVPQPTQ
jgi:hypothetical protein